MNIRILDVVLFMIPALVGYGTQAFCKVGKDAGADVKFRPPSWVFGLVWAVLFALFGLSWAVASRRGYSFPMTMILYGLTTLLLALWIVTYGCAKNKKVASWILVATSAAALASFAQGCAVSKALISPLIA